MATAARHLTAADVARAEVDAYLAAAQRKSLLRFITCGSVDDGKSTLIGRLLFDSKMLFEDQLAALASESKKVGTQGDGLDFALLVDGLGAEREQGITIDVAYRFFATDKRKFIVADTPGHEQYTRNMVTGASTADLAVILVDARKGVLTQTRRHSFIAKLLGIRQLVLAINKMDLVDYSEQRFNEIVAQYGAFAREAGIDAFTAIPVSGLGGDNVTVRSTAMPWYGGPALLEHLEAVETAGPANVAPFRLAVQWVNRPNQHFRGYAGRIASGSIRPGDRVAVLPSGQTSTVQRIATFDGDLDRAVAGQSVTLTLTDELDCSRGDVIVAASAPPALGTAFSANLVWMAAGDLVPGRSYWLKIGTRTVSATVSRVDHVVDINSLGRETGRPLKLNDIGVCQLRLDRPVPVVSYADSRQLGGFILIDKVSNATVAAGMVSDFVQDRAARDPGDRDTNQILWIGGDSEAERNAAAAKVQRQFEALGRRCLVLSERNVRSGLSSDLDVSGPDRAENIRRVREVATLVSAVGTPVLITLNVSDAEAHPGKRLAASELDQDWNLECVI